MRELERQRKGEESGVGGEAREECARVSEAVERSSSANDQGTNPAYVHKRRDEDGKRKGEKEERRRGRDRGEGEGGGAALTFLAFLVFPRDEGGAHRDKFAQETHTDKHRKKQIVEREGSTRGGKR